MFDGARRWEAVADDLIAILCRASKDGKRLHLHVAPEFCVPFLPAPGLLPIPVGGLVAWGTNNTNRTMDLQKTVGSSETQSWNLARATRDFP